MLHVSHLKGFPKSLGIALHLLQAHLLNLDANMQVGIHLLRPSALPFVQVILFTLRVEYYIPHPTVKTILLLF